MSQKVVAITGAYGNLGIAVAQVLKQQDAKLALIDRSATHVGQIDDDDLHLGGVNLSIFAEAQRVVEKILTHYGRLDALINIAGTFRWETLQDGNLDTWDFLYEVNLKTAAAMSKAVLPALLIRGGRIINIGAGVAVNKAGQGMGAYAASKAGVIKLTEALSEEVKDLGVTVNAVLPSIIDTSQNRADMPQADFSRWVTPDALAKVISFLLSDQASVITGAAIPVYGRV
jgi:NAD(P)-dependent dehydrogenase (short-subunit alcohol dehydrogenase family)